MEELNNNSVVCLLTDIHESLCSLLDKLEKSHISLQHSDLEDVQQKLWQIKISGNEALSSELRQSLGKVILALVNLAKIPELLDSDVPESAAINYEICIENAVYAIHMLHILVGELSIHKAIVLKNAEWLQNSVIIPSLTLCATYHQVCPWSSEKTSKCCQDLAEVILKLTECDALSQLMGGASGIFPNGIAKILMTSFMPQLRRETWKRNPALKYSFAWCLHEVKHPHLENLLSEVLPPPLLFVDDYVLENKILGVKCLHHIIKNVAPSELKWYGRAEVVYNALEHLMYTREAELISVLHPCMLDILHVVEENPAKPSSLGKRFRYDKVLVKILTDMEFEQQLVLRRAFSQYVYLFIEKLGMNAVRHIKHLLRVISEYLEVSDGPEENTRNAMLLALKSLIITAWPRISYHMETILKILLKLIYDLNTSCSATGLKERRQLTQVAIECLELLKKLNSRQFQLLLEPLLELEQDIPGKDVFEHLLKTPT